MSLYQVEFTLPIDNTDIDYACTDSESEESSNSNQNTEGSQADKLDDEPTKKHKADGSDNSFHDESTLLPSKPSSKSKVLSIKSQKSGTIHCPIKRPTSKASSSHGTKCQHVDAPTPKSSKKAKTDKALIKDVQTSSCKKTTAITLSTVPSDHEQNTFLDNTKLPEAPSKNKGKGKAVGVPVKTSTKAPEEDNDAVDEPKPKTIYDIDLSLLFKDCSGCGHALQTSTTWVVNMFKKLGCPTLTQNLQEVPSLVMGPGGTMQPFNMLYYALMQNPGADLSINTTCTECHEHSLVCELGPGNMVNNNLNKQFLQALSSPLSLLFQASSIVKSMDHLDLINQQVQFLQNQASTLSATIEAHQKLLQSSTNDPCAIIHFLSFNNANFVASTKQLNHCITCFGWTADQMGVPDSFEINIHHSANFTSIDQIHVFLKGTKFNVTGLKCGLYEIVNSKLLVKGTDSVSPESVASASSNISNHLFVSLFLTSHL
ncbi:hypothetical protein Moror_12219 [Moniliophthora roreri MCA 2997]|uniref:Uncharacterized protein n=1 Tax=Moniliophthora roreri (strain MCA 2997) TaxID=1381753 RepID=V2W6B8_MONRO|nr:hypothetical protein Moror_12219 [Moniliophthora roreri MCA 2997]